MRLSFTLFNAIFNAKFALKLPTADGKKYETDCANTESVFRIIQSIPSSLPDLVITTSTFIDILFGLLYQILSGTPCIASMLPQRPVAVVRHRQEERINLCKVRFPIIQHRAIRVCPNDLANKERICRKRDSLDEPAFEIDRALFDHRCGLQRPVEHIKYMGLVGLFAGNETAVIGLLQKIRGRDVH